MPRELVPQKFTHIGLDSPNEEGEIITQMVCYYFHRGKTIDNPTKD